MLELLRSLNVGTQLRRLRVLPLLFIAACGGSEDGPTAPSGPDDPDGSGGPDEPPTPVVSDAPGLSTTDVVSMRSIVLDGLPEDQEDLVAEVAGRGASTPDSAGAFLLPLDPLGGARYALIIPIHPEDPIGGGAAEVRVWGDEFVTEAVEITMAGLPDAPGSFEEFADSLQALLDLRFGQLGTSRAEVLDTDWSTDLEPGLFPLALAQTLLADPSHDRDLRDMLAGSPSFQAAFGSSTPDLELLDGLTAAGNLVAAVSETLEFERGLTPAMPPHGPGADTSPAAPGQRAPAPIVNISSAAELDAAMDAAWSAANELDPNSETGKLLQGYGFTLGAVGLVTGPAGTVVATGLGTALWAYQTYLDAKSKLLPKEFVPGSLTFDVDIATFEEDRPGPGTWSNVSVDAQSEGWILDRALIDLFSQVAGNAKAYRGWLDRAGAEATDLVDDIFGFLSDQRLSLLPAAESGLVEVPPEVWADIDVTGEPWTSGRVVGGDAITLVTQTAYDPVRPGEALLTVETSPSRFGRATPALYRETIRVDAIGVSILATATGVQPGEVVDLQVLVDNALDTSLEWTLSPGASWASGPTDIGGGAWSAQVQTPGDIGGFPVQVTAESTAEGGARDTPGAPARRDVLLISSAAVIVEPSSVFLDPGESQTFEAIVLGAASDAVTWTATGPDGPVSIGSNGTFVAPQTPGDYLITATSVDVPSAEGFANVTVVGQCFWTMDMGGQNGGTWSGDFAGHTYPDGPIGGAFNMSFAPDAEASPGASGNIVSQGPGSAGTGAWPVVFGFAAGNQTWVATVDSDDETEAILTVDENDGFVVRGTVSGTALLPLGGDEVELAPFTLTFRSNDLFGDGACGGS